MKVWLVKTRRKLSWTNTDQQGGIIWCVEEHCFQILAETAPDAMAMAAKYAAGQRVEIRDVYLVCEKLPPLAAGR